MALGLCLHQKMWTVQAVGATVGASRTVNLPVLSAAEERRASWNAEAFVHYFGKIKLHRNPKSHPQQCNDECFATPSSSIFEIILFFLATKAVHVHCQKLESGIKSPKKKMEYIYNFVFFPEQWCQNSKPSASFIYSPPPSPLPFFPQAIVRKLIIAPDPAP